MKYILAFLLLMPFVIAATVDQVDVNLVNYNPVPVIPGDSFDITLEVENNNAENVTVEIKARPDDPFFSEDNGRETIILDAGESEEVTFRIGVEGDTTKTEEELEFEYCINNECDDIRFDIKIQKRIILNVEKVELVPETVAPGESALLKITLENIGSSLIKDVIVSLDLTEIPFSPVSSTSRSIDTIEGNSMEVVEFNIIALPDAVSGIYKVNMHLTFFDESNELHEKDELISLRVSSPPELSIIVDSNVIIEQTNEIIVKFVNTGLGNIKFLDVRLMPSDDYELLSNNHVYIGDVDSDDFETVEFSIFLKNKIKTLPLSVRYMDDNNEEYNDFINVKLNAYTEEEAKELGLIKTNRTSMIITVIVTLAILFFIIRRLRKRR